MSQIFSMSVASQKLQPIIVYFDEELEEDIERWHQAIDPLKQDLYDRMDEIVAEGEKIMEQRQREQS